MSPPTNEERTAADEEEDVETLRTAEGLAAGCYTAQQLQHGTAEHLHITSRRCFIGPIPEAWLSKHRKSWYQYRPSFARYSSRTASFLAAANVANVKNVSGLEGMTGDFAQSFPQPIDLDTPDQEAEPQEEEEETEPTQDEESAPNLRPLVPERTHTAATSPLASPSSVTENPDVAARPKTTASGRGKHKKNGSSTGSSFWRKRPGPGKNRPAFLRKESGKSARSMGSSSFVTAAESLDGDNDDDDNDDGHANIEYQGHDREEVQPGALRTEETDPSRASSMHVSPETTRNAASLRSTAGLLDNAGNAGGRSVRSESVRDSHLASPRLGVDPNDPPKTPKSALKKPGIAMLKKDAHGDQADAQEVDRQIENLKPLAPTASNLVRFNEPTPHPARVQDPAGPNGDVQKRSVKTHLRRRPSVKAGQLVKAERMLVRIDSTVHNLGSDFDENSYFAKEAKAVNKWREFVVVCRQNIEEDDDAEFVLRMYKSRVVPLVEDKKTSKKYLHEIVLRKKDVYVNLFSTLDKTIVLWAPWKKFTRIYILKPQSSTDAVQWYHFLRTCLGWKRPPELRVHIPDLDVILTLDNPFPHGEKSEGGQTGDNKFRSELQDEGGAARIIILRCLQLLARSALSDTTDIWQHHGDRLGLAWRRYDRLEWISGVNEENMYGSMAMQVSHELEMLPKQHYPTCSKKQSGSRRSLEEPPPVEGFLVRMTSQKGRHKRAGKDFYKRLYFYTNNHLLCFCQPSKAIPPKPPVLASKPDDGDTPKAKEIADQIPLIYAVNPYPLNNGRVAWLDKSDEEKAEFDRRAFEEAERRTNVLLECEAYINLTHIESVKKSKGGAPPEEPGSEPEDDLPEDEEVETDEEEGQTSDKQQEAIARSFEIILKNGLTVRLQAFSKQARKEWVKRLRHLVRYWKARITEDSQLLKSIRHENLKRLQVDEQMEAVVGQYARKWEVRRSVASSDIWNMCSIASCRTMSLYGMLYRKPRLHGTFKRCNVILAHGKLLVFQSSLRKVNGRVMPHIHHERQEVIELEDTYIYSGLITDGDLLYQNQTFSPEHPGHSATPRVYLEDGWTSSDEDTMTCFCLWQGKRRSLFRGIRASDDGRIRSRLRYVSSLGVPGRTMVFKTRSRAERDRWVLGIGLEIERLKKGEASRESDIRITGGKDQTASKVP